MCAVDSYQTGSQEGKRPSLVYLKPENVMNDNRQWAGFHIQSTLCEFIKSLRSSYESVDTFKVKSESTFSGWSSSLQYTFLEYLMANNADNPDFALPCNFWLISGISMRPGRKAFLANSNVGGWAVKWQNQYLQIDVIGNFGRRISLLLVTLMYKNAAIKKSPPLCQLEQNNARRHQPYQRAPQIPPQRTLQSFLNCYPERVQWLGHPERRFALWTEEEEMEMVEGLRALSSSRLDRK
ncbi:hypothetical protein MP228_001598 [Amoeboaphelidium protococcarum]|nr:hypothetical protein MP228_001598 [Amoeboaphelidium protococcarum]